MPTFLKKFRQFQQDRYKKKIKKHPYPTITKFHLGSFLDAINGIVWTLKTQPNFAVEIIIFVLTFYALLLLYFLGIRIELLEILIILVLSFLLLIFELLNTSIESLSDEVAKGEYKEFIRIAKDTSAGAVFLCAIVWSLTVLIIMIPKLVVLI